jgi:hypothetical protein
MFIVDRQQKLTNRSVGKCARMLAATPWVVKKHPASLNGYNSVMRRAIRALPLVFCVVVLCLAAARRRASDPPPAPIQLDARRSFAVTDIAILDGFPLERVMTALTAGTTTSPVQLYQQWLDTFNAKPGMAAPDGPHCNDFTTDGSPSFNNFPRRCPTPEGLLAKDQPFTPPQFIPLGIINRFDLTPLDGSNCGQYRLIYARKFATTEFFHIIFEAVFRIRIPRLVWPGAAPLPNSGPVFRQPVPFLIAEQSWRRSFFRDSPVFLR